MTAIDGRALLLALILAGAILLSRAIRRETRRLPAVVDEALAKPPAPQPAPRPTPGAHAHYVCRTCHTPVCEVVTDGDRMLALIATWTCLGCADTLARLDQELTQ